MRKFLILFAALYLPIRAFASNVVTLDATKDFFSQIDLRASGKRSAVYKITSSFDLKKQEIYLPEDCILIFEGGVLKNGTLRGASTRVESPLVQIFSNVSMNGTWIVDGIRVEWFGAKPNRESFDCSVSINEAIRNGKAVSLPILISSATYYTSKTIELDGVGLIGVNSTQSVISFDANAQVGLYMKGQFRYLKNVRVQETKAAKKAICVKVGDLDTKTSSTRGYIEDIYVSGGRIGLDLEYQWCYKISGVLAKNNGIGIKVAKTMTYIENAIVEDNFICGVYATENGVKLYCSVIEGNSVGCFLNGKENAVVMCSFEGNVLKKGTDVDELKLFGINVTGGHIYAGTNHRIENLSIVSCHFNDSTGADNTIKVDRCSNFVAFGNINMRNLVTTKNCKIQTSDAFQ